VLWPGLAITRLFVFMTTAHLVLDPQDDGADLAELVPHRFPLLAHFRELLSEEFHLPPKHAQFGFPLFLDGRLCGA
jgi:hypothetical protein